MCSDRERTRAALEKMLRPKLLLASAALAALIIAAPAGAMNLSGSGFSIGRLGGPPRPNGGALSTVPHGTLPRSNGPNISTGNISSNVSGAGHDVGVVGRGGNSPSANPCGRLSRVDARRCGPGPVVNGGDYPGDGPPRHWGHPPPHWIPPQPLLPGNPIVVTTQPTSSGGPSPPSGSSPPGNPAPQAQRRSGSGVPAPNERRYVQDEVVVELAASASSQQTDALLRQNRLTRLQSVNFQLGGTTLMRLRIADRRSVPVVVRTLETNATVLSAQPNYLFAMQEETGTAPAQSEGDPAQYILQKMHLPQAHELAKGDKVLVAVIDSGVDVAHPDLAGDIAGTFDALGTGLKPDPHGTAIAGAIAAHGRLMGAAPAAQILAVRAFSGTGGADDGTTFAIMSGLNWAVSHGARIVNMSFAGPQDPGIARSLAAAHDRGVVLVAAAGNKGAKSPPLYPAADPNVIAVTSTDAGDQLPAFANRGRYVTVAAPGVDLMLLAPNGAMQFASGTSFSAAYVTGTAALMLERKPSLGPETLRQALAGTAHRLGSDKAADGQSGAGLVDAYQAVLSLAPAPVDAASAMPAAVR
jgi:subtilisin family serine protease